MPRIPSEKKSNDSDIDKVYFIYNPNMIQVVNNLANKSYNRIANIARHDPNKLNFAIVSEYLYYDVGMIASLIQDKVLPNDDRLKQFIDDFQKLNVMLGEKYRKNVSIIEDFYNTPIEKSIDDMDADELRDYIRKHLGK